MSEPVVITIHHRLGKDEAIRRLKSGLASANIPFVKVEREHWNGDQLEFGLTGMGQKASGTALVSDDAVRLELILPWLLQRFAELATSALATRAKVLLEKK
ncbi:polyhydroxyalkanoic acid system family protein [Hyphomicrobium sp.]|uniref:polyhydroxyalkanoic acid system family protein n=1 Tax=Hyphomicrobium sp. TaxID=82 RepID=UPI002D76ED2C|nr:polyhydroxyalkanoic acid system family protein [Hyphomicrobium sp.]HET6388534.1 polyhydroxyalkanoic acid system family protein [Hyphomicrobium sp.]